MPSKYQNKLNQIFESLPTRFKFQALIESLYTEPYSDPPKFPMTKEDLLEFDSYFSFYNQLPFLYYEKNKALLFLNNFYLRKMLSIQKKITVDALKIIETKIEKIDKLESTDSSKEKQIVANLIDDLKNKSQENQEGTEKEIKESLEYVDREIKEIESKIGFSYPLRHLFEL